MEFDEQLELDHLFLKERKCRSCGKIKDLMVDFYLTRKNRRNASAYSYECKVCTIKRIVSNRKVDKKIIDWQYPDW
mgnify:FL=1|tara:strand:- start:906 stop:1133 length:228 start_codon:yes stop_codon:yes gene_type:complete